MNIKLLLFIIKTIIELVLINVTIIIMIITSIPDTMIISPISILGLVQKVAKYRYIICV